MKEQVQEQHPVVKVIRFNEDSLNIFEEEGEFYIAMKPICEVLGLAWNGQFELMQRDPVLSQVIRIIRTTSKGRDGKTYNVEMVCLPLDYFHGWLFKIDLARYDGPRRDKLIDYQRRCYQALRSALMPQVTPAAIVDHVGRLATQVLEVSAHCNFGYDRLQEYCWYRLLGLSQYKAASAAGSHVTIAQQMDRRLDEIGIRFPVVQGSQRKKWIRSAFEKLLKSSLAGRMQEILPREVYHA